MSETLCALNTAELNLLTVQARSAGTDSQLRLAPDKTHFLQFWMFDWFRLEQRVGRIHRYGQEKNCLVFNFVAQNTREGRVLQTLIERLKEIREEGTQPFRHRGEIC